MLGGIHFLMNHLQPFWYIVCNEYMDAALYWNKYIINIISIIIKETALGAGFPILIMPNIFSSSSLLVFGNIMIWLVLVEWWEWKHNITTHFAIISWKIIKSNTYHGFLVVACINAGNISPGQQYAFRNLMKKWCKFCRNCNIPYSTVINK